jgi:hypothetical protein
MSSGALVTTLVGEPGSPSVGLAIGQPLKFIRGEDGALGLGEVWRNGRLIGYLPIFVAPVLIIEFLNRNRPLACRVAASGTRHDGTPWIRVETRALDNIDLGELCLLRLEQARALFAQTHGFEFGGRLS